LPAVALLALLLLLAGCGGGGDKPSDPVAVSDTVTGFTKAFAAGDGEQACDLLTKAAQDAFVTRAQTTTRAKDCPTSLKRLHDIAGPSVTDPLGAATVSEVKVTGSTATARLTASGHPTIVNLSKIDGDWKLNGVPGI
jgi:hypothetical protein